LLKTWHNARVKPTALNPIHGDKKTHNINVVGNLISVHI
jgi:hypothetical protein